MKRIIGILVLSTLVSILASQALSWKLGLLATGASGETSVPFGRPVQMSDGEQFQILISPDKASYLYVLYEDTTGSVSVLFKGVVKSGEELLLPGESSLYSVGPPGGSERIVFVIALRPMNTLEALLSHLAEADGAQKALDEIARIKNSLSSLAEAPEKPVPMAGTARHLVDSTVTEFDGQDTYVKTIRLDH
jgi:hypothetical protein